MGKSFKLTAQLRQRPFSLIPVSPARLALRSATHRGQGSKPGLDKAGLIARGGLAFLAGLLGYWVIDQRNRRRSAQQTAEADQPEEHLARMQAELKHRDARYRSLFEASPDAVTVTDLQGKILLCNQRTAELHGFNSPDELTGRNVVTLIAPEDRRRALKNTRKALELGSLYNVPYTLLRQDGSRFPGEISISRMLDGEGCTVALTGITRDISGRKQAEERIERQIERLATLRTIDLAISASLDLEVTLEVLLEHVIAQLKVDAADILLLNPYSQTFDYAAGHGFHTSSAKHSRQRLAEGIAGRPAFDRQPVRVTAPVDQGSTTRLAALMEAEGFEVYYGAPLITKGLWRGVLEIFHRTPLEPDQEWLDFLETLSGQAAIAIGNAELFENLQLANQELTLTYDRTLEGWVRALDLRDHETENHTQRVAEQTVRLAQRMGLSDEDLVHVWRGALLHDIGKMGIPDRLLHKPDRLTPEEWLLMKQHTDYAQEMLAPIGYLRPALEIPYYHHEKWDGSGYPRGLKTEEIPLAARIFAVIDVWDALRTYRVYRKEKPIWPEDEVRQYLRDQAGRHFDPQVVKVFLRMLAEED